MIQLQTFSQDPSLLEKEIYQWRDRLITNIWISLSPIARRELDEFIWQYLDSSGFPRDKEPFLRIDAYINPDGSSIQILDINASFVDGWWNALNMTRSIGGYVNRALLETFPRRLMLWEEQYRPEFELTKREFSQLGIKTKEVTSIDSRTTTYVYGNPPIWMQEENNYPFDALRMDNKKLLARFSERWKWNTVRIPKLYTPESTAWRDIPYDGVLKLASKQDITENPDVRRVQIWVKRNSLQLRRLWDAGKIVVQEPVQTMKNPETGDNTQATILTTRQSVVWYTQFSPKSIINDDSTQWPLILQN